KQGPMPARAYRAQRISIAGEMGPRLRGDDNQIEDAASSLHRHDEVAELVGDDFVSRLDHRGRVHLLDDGGAGEAGAGGQLLAAIDRRRLPAALEPDAAVRGRLRALGRLALRE